MVLGADICFALMPVHEARGCEAIVDGYGRLLEAAGRSWTKLTAFADRQAGCMLPVPIAKKSYGWVVAVEAQPPESWLEAGGCWWMPMAEFVTCGHLRALHSAVGCIWHSAAGCAAAKALRPDLRHLWWPYGISPMVGAESLSSRPLRLLLREQPRSLDVHRLAMRLTEAVDPQCIWLMTDNPRLYADIPLGRVLPASLAHGAWLEVLGGCSVYVGGRAMEGVGVSALEAAACGVVVATCSPTTAEYLGPGEALTIAPEAEEQGEWLVGRWGWGKEEDCESPAAGLAEAVSGLMADEGRLRAMQQSALARSAELYERFAQGVGQWAACYEPPSRPPDAVAGSRKLLVVQGLRDGGQGMHELWANTQLASRSHLSLFAACVSQRQSSDSLQQAFNRLALRAEGIRQIGCAEGEWLHLDPAVCVFHWSGGCMRPADRYQRVMRVIGQMGRAPWPVVCVVHDVAPASWPQDFRPDLVLYPTACCMQQYDVQHAGLPRAVLPHFLDPELLAAPKTTSGSWPPVLGIVGRMHWTKLDPDYRWALAVICRQFGAVCTWFSPFADGRLYSMYLESGMRLVVEPLPHEPERRAQALDRLTLGLVITATAEGFGLGAGEMAARGVPVISNQPAICDLFQALRVSSPGELQTVVGNLLTNGRLMAEAGARCKQAAGVLPTASRWEEAFTSHLANVRRGGRRWSVLVTCHNCRPWIEGCVRSALAALDELRTPGEVLVVVDGDQDGSLQVVRGLADADARIRLLEFGGEGHCQAWSWRRGLEAASGELCAMLDGDDELLPGALWALELPMASDPHTHMAYGRSRVLGADGKPCSTRFSWDHEGRMLERMLAGENVVSHPLAVRTAVAACCGLDERLEASADKDLALRMDEAGCVAFVDRELYLYRWMREGSVTCTKRELQIACRRRVLEDAEGRRRTAAAIGRRRPPSS